MSETIASRLAAVLEQIDRPGSFCVSGSAAAVLPGLEVPGMGPIAFPLTPKQAKELKKHCSQAPYGKGTETIVDTKVRRVLHLTPEQFTLTNPDWQGFLKQTVKKVQEELGLEKQKLEAHLYDLLLYEPGSFFLPHRDGEKLDRMVATLVVCLPSSFEGGELVVRHEGQEQTIAFGAGENNQFRIHYAAFYADCEHEVRPLHQGYRLCLVYNLTLEKAKSKKGITAPRTAEHIQQVAEILRDWVADESEETPHKLVATLDHQYTQEGLAWDALKGVDRVKARVLLEGAQQADCEALLALLTYHESGSAEYAGGYYGRRRGWYDDEDEDAGDYEMGEVFETSLTAEHWSDSRGNRLPIGTMHVKNEELIDPEALESVEPEEEFEGYTGNAGMTLDRWYRHAAIFLWPRKNHFDVLCDAGSQSAAAGLQLLVKQWQHAGKKQAASLREQCVAFARALLERWPQSQYRGFQEDREACPLMHSLAALDEAELIRAYLKGPLARDASLQPGKALAKVCDRHGWQTFQPELEALFAGTKANTLDRNLRLLEDLCTARVQKKAGWAELCASLARASLQAVEAFDGGKLPSEYYVGDLERAKLLVWLARSLLATGQEELLARLVEHALARPRQYPLTEAHVEALGKLQPWLKKNFKKPSPALARWVAAVREQLETLTAEAPRPPADFRRPAAVSCNCALCAELKQFLADHKAEVHRFTVAQDRRKHLESTIRQDRLDVNTKTEERGRPYTLVCTKNTASYHAAVKKFEWDQKHLAALRMIEASLPK